MRCLCVAYMRGCVCCVYVCLCLLCACLYFSRKLSLKTIHNKSAFIFTLIFSLGFQNYVFFSNFYWRLAFFCLSVLLLRQIGYSFYQGTGPQCFKRLWKNSRKTISLSPTTSFSYVEIKVSLYFNIVLFLCQRLKLKAFFQAYSYVLLPLTCFDSQTYFEQLILQAFRWNIVQGISAS
jgi:hypothetical protein